MNTMRSLYDGAGGEAAAASPLAGGAQQQQQTDQQAAELPAGAFRADAFHAALPEAVRSDPNLAKYKTLEEFAHGHVNAVKLIGKDPKNLIEFPEKVDDAAITGIASRLGLPKEVKDYKVEAPQNTPEFLALNTDLGKSLVATAHAKGVLPGQFQAIYGVFAEAIGKAATEQETAKTAAATAAITGLKTEWGQAFDTKIGDANTFLDKFGGQEFRDVLIANGLDTNPIVLKALAAAGAIHREDDAGDGKGGGSPSFGHGMTPAEAKAKAQELQQQSLNEKNPAARRKLQDEAAKYYAIASPKAAA